MVKTHAGANFSANKMIEYFSRYGVIISFKPAILISRKDGYKQAFLMFRDYQSAESAINDSPHIVNDLIVVVLNAKDWC